MSAVVLMDSQQALILLADDVTPREDHPHFVALEPDLDGRGRFQCTQALDSGTHDYVFDVGAAFTHDVHGDIFESEAHIHPAHITFTLDCSGDYMGCIPDDEEEDDEFLTEGSDCSQHVDRCAGDLNLTCAQNLQGPLSASICVGADLCKVSPTDADYR